MNNILMAIKPIYAERIINGSKKVEFRKRRFAKEIDKIFIYSTFPVKKIVGYFTINYIIKDNPINLWFKCYKIAGIDQISFGNYFKKSLKGYAILIKKVVKFKKGVYLKEIKPPQSFRYLDDKISKEIIEKGIK